MAEPEKLELKVSLGWLPDLILAELKSTLHDEVHLSNLLLLTTY